MVLFQARITTTLTIYYDRATLPQSHTQSPQALWPAVGCQERLWGTGILLLQDFCGKTMQAITGQPIIFFFKFSTVSSGDQLLAKEPEDSGYEINTSCANKGYTDSDSIPAKKDKKGKY